jgi:hypothetical protein
MKPVIRAPCTRAAARDMPSINCSWLKKDSFIAGCDMSTGWPRRARPSRGACSSIREMRIASLRQATATSAGSRRSAPRRVPYKIAPRRARCLERRIVRRPPGGQQTVLRSSRSERANRRVSRYSVHGLSPPIKLEICIQVFRAKAEESSADYGFRGHQVIRSLGPRLTVSSPVSRWALCPLRDRQAQTGCRQKPSGPSVECQAATPCGPKRS